MRALLKSYLTPIYTEVQLVIMSTMIILLLLTDKSAYDFAQELPILPLLLVLVSYSIYHAFSKKQKSQIAIAALFLLAVGVNGWTAFFASLHVIEEGLRGFLMIFPLLNMLGAVLLFFGAVERQVISKENSHLYEILIAIGGVVLTFTLATVYFEIYWALLFSFCLTYGVLLDALFAYLRRTGAHPSPVQTRVR